MSVAKRVSEEMGVDLGQEVQHRLTQWLVDYHYQWPFWLQCGDTHIGQDSGDYPAFYATRLG